MVGSRNFLVISDLGSEHLGNLITMHIEREAEKKKQKKKKKSFPICKWKASGIEGI